MTAPDRHDHHPEHAAAPEQAGESPASLWVIAREWTRIGTIGFGGPPAHIALFRELCVERRGWLSREEFEDAIATTNLLPGPGSTQLAIYCGWRVGGTAGAWIGGAGFILPGLVVIIALSALFLTGAPPAWVLGAGAGAGAAVAAVALQAGGTLLRPSWERVSGAQRARWCAYVVAGGAATAVAGQWVVLVLLACGFIELAWRRPPTWTGAAIGVHPWPVAAAAATTGGLGALVWMAFKVGALSYGGGFVIIPLMQGDAVGHYHWMTGAQFLNAVALGQITPGPVVQTVSAVGYAAAGLVGGLLAAVVAFSPSFVFVLAGAPHFGRLRGDARAGAFLAGAGPAAIGAILGSAVPLALALTQAWQYAVLAAAAVLLLLLRRGVVLTLLLCGVAGVVIALAGAPVG